MRATLVIGLGGTGTLTCKLTKKLFLEEFGGEEKMPANVKFLCIDTRATAEKEEEWYSWLPSDDSVSKMVAGISETDFSVMQRENYLKRNPQIKEWLNAPLPIKDVAEAWEIRQAGRLAFWRHRKAIANIQGTIFSLVEFLRGPTIEGQLPECISLEDGLLDVFIINSLAGGTGSGMFFDVAGLIKKKCQQDAEITLLSLLPDLFIPNIDEDRSIAQLYANTYAALKELNHYMRDREPEIDHRWIVNYSKSDKVCIGEKLKNRPASLFDNIYLVDQQNRSNESLKNRLLILPLIAEYLYNSIMKVGASLRHSQGTEERRIEPEQWCSGLGCSILSFPLEEIREVCVYRLLGEVMGEAYSGKGFDSKKDVEDVVKDMMKAGNDFDYQGWMRSLSPYMSYYPPAARSIMTGGRRAYYNNLNQNVVRSLKRQLESHKKQIQSNYTTVLKEVKAALKRIVDEAIEQKGIRYARALLERLKEDLNFWEKIDAEIEALEITIKTKEEEIAPKLEKVKQLCRKLIDFTRWGVYAENNLQPLIDEIAALTGNKLKKEKLFYVKKILKELVEEGGIIDKEIDLLKDCLEDLKELKDDFTEAEKVSLRVLRFSSAKEDKKGRAPEKVDKFYKEHFSKEKPELEKKIREELKKGEPIKGEELKQYLEKQLERLSRLTLKDIIPEAEMEEEIARGLKASRAFWKHNFGEVKTETFIISGFQVEEMKQYVSLAGLTSTPLNTIAPADSPDTIAKKQRKIVFITVEFGVPIGDVQGLEIWESNYRKHNPRKNWEIHLTRPAVDFEELLLGPGMGEERALLMTCKDFGVVFQMGNSYQYKKEGRSKEIAKGYDNTLKKLQEDPSLCETLINILKREISAASGEEIEDYLKNHHGYSKDKFLKNHKNRYKDKGSGKPIPSHEIPSYIKKELEKRLGI